MGNVTFPSLGQIPVNKGLVDKTGNANNSWYVYWQKENQLVQFIGNLLANSTFVINSPATGQTASIAIGHEQLRPAALAPGNLYFTTNTGIIYAATTTGSTTEYTPLIPAYTGDVTSSVGSTVLNLTEVNSTPGTFTNPVITVDSTGRITSVSGGGQAVVAPGGPGSVLFSDGNGNFVADTDNFNYTNNGVPFLTIGADDITPTSVGPTVALVSATAAENSGVPVPSTLSATSLLVLSGAEGVSLTAGSVDWITVKSNGELDLNGSAGVAGQILTSGGPNEPPTWEDSGASSVSIFSGNLNCGQISGSTTAIINLGTLSNTATSSINLGNI